MELYEIVNKAYRDARRKIPNADLVSMVFESSYPSKLVSHALREKFMDRFVIYSLQLLNKRCGAYPSHASKQYRDLLFHALKANGARKTDCLDTPFPYISFGNQPYAVIHRQDDQIALQTIHYHASINVCADPWKVAELLAMVHEYPIAETLYEEIYRESCDLYRLHKRMESCAHELIDDILENGRFTFTLTLCSTEKFRIKLLEGAYFVAIIFTDLQHIREDITNTIANHKEHPISENIQALQRALLKDELNIFL